MNANPDTDIADHPARILVVNDEPDNRELLQVILGWAGFVVVTAACGEEALATVAQDAPDLILLDVMMPGMNGYEVLAMIKGDVATKYIPVMMVSAIADRNARARGLSAGAADFLAKPIEHAELMRRVRSLLRPSQKSVVARAVGSGVAGSAVNARVRAAPDCELSPTGKRG